MFEEYSSSWFSGGGRDRRHGRLHRITEKPFKPLLCFQPFIVLGPVGALQLIREYGFETFPGLFDESYDEAATSRSGSTGSTSRWSGSAAWTRPNWRTGSRR